MSVGFLEFFDVDTMDEVRQDPSQSAFLADAWVASSREEDARDEAALLVEEAAWR